MFDRMMFRLWALLALAFLAACGSQLAAPTAAVPASTRAPAAPPTAAAASAPTAAMAPVPTGAPTAGVAQAEDSAIPSSLTPEGYHVLGRPDAPVTLVMYSDFL